MDSRDAAEHDAFPVPQIPPVVHVDRLEDTEADAALEDGLETVVKDFNGVYIGT